MSDGDSIDRDEQRREKKREKQNERFRRYRERHAELLKERQRKYREENREELRRRAREKYAADPEKHKAKWRRWRDNNPESCKESQKRSRNKHREENLRRGRERYAADAERQRAEAAKYRAENPEKVKESKRRCYQKYRDKNLAAAKARYQRQRDFLDQILRQCPCADCGEADWRCLEFHHIDPSDKDMSVTQMTCYSRERLLREIAKCDVVCANCHLKRHAVDGVVRYAKKKGAGNPKRRPKTPYEELSKKQQRARRINDKFRERHRDELLERNREYQRARYQTNKAKVDAIKAETGCVRCGEKDPVCLEFHHRDPSQKVNQIAAFCGFSDKRLMDEIAKCDLLCANCHAKQHAVERRLPRSLKKVVVQGELF